MGIVTLDMKEPITNRLDPMKNILTINIHSAGNRILVFKY